MATIGDKDSNSRQTESARKHDRSNSRSNSGSASGSGSNSRRSTEQSGSAQNGRVPIAEAMRLAVGQLAELLQSEPGSVSSVKATGDGWTADVEVVEIERVPDTTSVMGSYRVQLDGRGDLLGYERTRRYARGQIDQRK